MKLTKDQLANEQLAKRVIKQVHALTPKLRDLEKDLRKLWSAFAHLPHGQKILGCRTKTEFCEKKLSRSMRTVQYLLNGGNNQTYIPAAQRREFNSPPESAAAPAVEYKQVHVRGDENAPIFWKTLNNRINPLLPSCSDGSEHVLIKLLEKLSEEPLPARETCLVQGTIGMLERIATNFKEYATKLRARVQAETGESFEQWTEKDKKDMERNAAAYKAEATTSGK